VAVPKAFHHREHRVHGEKIRGRTSEERRATWLGSSSLTVKFGNHFDHANNVLIELVEFLSGNPVFLMN
jgi:hypothetical protein